MADFKKGDLVVQVQPAPIMGSVAGYAVDQNTGALQIFVEWSDDAGVHSRYFKPEELMLKPE